MNILEPIFNHKFFYDLRQWSPQGLNIRFIADSFQMTSSLTNFESFKSKPNIKPTQNSNFQAAYSFRAFMLDEREVRYARIR
jgi:hypothetical protein